MCIGDRLPKARLGRVSALGAAVLMVASLASQSGVAAATLKTLYSFCQHRSGGACPDGAEPLAGLIRDASGHLYGTTGSGGAAGAGTVFELTPNPARTIWTYKILYSFDNHDGSANLSGGGVIMDAAGRLYGTTYGGGALGYGTVFELIPNAAKTRWTYKILHSFGLAADGAQPLAGLISDAAGRLYGTTAGGGFAGSGTVFELTPNPAKTIWAERVLYRFCAQDGPACPDGQFPYAGLIMDASGHLYGTTIEGGAHFEGTVFELTPNAAKTRWTETVQYSFCARGGFSKCTDGDYPEAGLIRDASGHLYGTTFFGGAPGPGTVFELTP